MKQREGKIMRRRKGEKIGQVNDSSMEQGKKDQTVRRLKLAPVMTVLLHPIIPIILLLFYLLSAGWELVQQAPAVWAVSEISVSSTATPVILGADDLGQRRAPDRADIDHLQLDLDAGKGWLLSNRSTAKRVDIGTDQAPVRHLRQWTLQQGDRFFIGDVAIDVAMANEQRLQLKEHGGERAVIWEDGRLTNSQQKNYRYCDYDSEGWLQHFKSELKQWANSQRWALRRYLDYPVERPLFSIGGQVQCHDRWQIDALEPNSLTVIWRAGEWWLSANKPDLKVLIERHGHRSALHDLAIAGHGDNGLVEQLVIGRTHYRVGPEDGLFKLKPVAQIDLFGKKPEMGTNPAVTTVWRLYSWSGELAAESYIKPIMVWSSLLLLLFAGLYRARVIAKTCSDERTAERMIGRYGVAVALFGALWTGWFCSIDLAILMGLVWCVWLIATAVLFWSGWLAGRGGWLWLLTFFLAGFGFLLQAQLAVDADSTQWLDLTVWHGKALLLIAAVVTLFGQFQPHQIDALWFRLTWPYDVVGVVLRAGIALLVLGLLLGQLLFGSEHGFAGFQPVEVGKLVLIFIWSYMVLYLYEAESVFGGWLIGLIMTVVSIVTAVLIIMVSVNDYSPWVIIFLLLIAYCWSLSAHPVTRGSYSTLLMRLLLVVFPILVVGLSARWVWLHPPDINNPLLLADQLRVWSSPWNYPQNGLQYQRILTSVHDGGWSGTGWFGSNGAVMQVAALQDDFILTFVLNKMGGVGGMVLLSVQLSWVLTMLLLAHGLCHRYSNLADRQQRVSYGLLGLVLFGLSSMQAIHWLIAWANVLGLVPLMGQPATWLSRGNSHLFSLALPTLLLGLLGAAMVRNARDFACYQHRRTAAGEYGELLVRDSSGVKVRVRLLKKRPRAAV